MVLLISEKGKIIRSVTKTPFPKEAFLQEYLFNNPEAIPLSDIRDGTKLIVLVREFPTDSGPIDVLGIDQIGNLYVIETKLYANSDKRRVIAQILDYGASL